METESIRVIEKFEANLNYKNEIIKAVIGGTIGIVMTVIGAYLEAKMNKKIKKTTKIETTKVEK